MLWSQGVCWLRLRADLPWACADSESVTVMGLFVFTVLFYGWTFYSFLLVAGRNSPLDLLTRTGEGWLTRARAGLALTSSPLLLVAAAVLTQRSV